MSDSTDQIQALLTQIDQALHQLSPPIALLVWGEGIVQSRQVLQQVRDYLLSSLQNSSTTFNQAETLVSESPEILSQQFSHLQQEIERLRQERQDLKAEIQQLQTQQQSAVADYSPASGVTIVPEALDNFADLPRQSPIESSQNLNLPERLNAQDQTEGSNNLSDIFGELQLDRQSQASYPEPEPHRILDATIHLEFPEPPLDGQEYILASPHENLLPVDQDEDQVDSLLLVGRGTLQRLESELMSLEELSDPADDSFQSELETVIEEDHSVEVVPTLQQLYAQFEQNWPQLNRLSDSTPQTLGELLQQTHPTAIPSPASPEAQSPRLEELSQKFSQSRVTPPKKASQNRASSEG